MNSGPKTIKSIFFDTNALRAISFEKIKLILAACRDGIITVSVCEPVIHERANQYYNDSVKSLLMPFRLVDTISWFLYTFEIHNVHIVKINQEYEAAAAQLVNDENTYFSENNENDLMDAMILCMALDTVKKEYSVILCMEKKLKREFEKNGYIVNNDPGYFIDELIGDHGNQSFRLPEITRTKDFNPDLLKYLKKADPVSFEQIRDELSTLPSSSDKLREKIEQINNLNSELITKILGYSQWFSPIKKEDLLKFLSSSFDLQLIKNTYHRLTIEGLLIDTGNYLFTNDKDEESEEICKQAMMSIMDEILDLLGND